MAPKCANPSCNNLGTKELQQDGGNVYLCLDCYERMAKSDLLRAQAVETNQNSIANFLNYIQERAEAVAGLRYGAPRFQTTQPIIHHDEKTYNNLSIEGGKVGVINYGNVKKLDVDMSTLKELGAPDLSQTLQDFVQAVHDSENLSDVVKAETIDNITFIMDQFKANPENKRPSVVKSVMASIKSAITTSSALTSLWINLQEIFEKAF